MTFEQKGSKSESQKIFELLDGADFGTVFTFDQVSDALGRDFLDGGRTPLYVAVRRLERERSRTADSVRNVGYRIVEPREHEGLGRRHHRKGQRQLRKSLSKLKSTDRSRLTAEELRRIDSLEITVSRHADAIRRLEEQGDRNEQAIHDARGQTAKTTADLLTRMERLEEQLRKRQGEAWQGEVG